MLGAMLMELPVHGGAAIIEHLHAIAARVALATFRMPREHHGEGDESPAIAGPAFQYREIEHRKAIALDDLLARTVLYHLWKERADLGELRQHLDLVDQPVRRLELQVFTDARADLVERIDL